MKKIITILSGVIACCALQAQDPSSPTSKPITKIYFQAGAGQVSRGGSQGEMSVQAIIKNKWVTTVSYHTLTMKAKNLPGDYEPGWGWILFIPYTNNEGNIKMDLFNFTAGRYFPAGQNCWFTTEAGISIINGEKASFERATDVTPVGFLFGEDHPSNYTVTKERKTAIGGVIRADFNWAFTSFMGAGAGVCANFNSIQSPVGYEIKLIVGRMNRAKK
ncbi:MAG: hypothetical protein ABIR30_06165 [Chitinophagaceae bacterium]